MSASASASSSPATTRTLRLFRAGVHVGWVLPELLESAAFRVEDGGRPAITGEIRDMAIQRPAAGWTVEAVGAWFEEYAPGLAERVGAAFTSHAVGVAITFGGWTVPTMTVGAVTTSAPMGMLLRTEGYGSRPLLLALEMMLDGVGLSPDTEDDLEQAAEDTLNAEADSAAIREQADSAAAHMAGMDGLNEVEAGILAAMQAAAFCPGAAAGEEFQTAMEARFPSPADVVPVTVYLHGQVARATEPHRGGFRG